MAARSWLPLPRVGPSGQPRAPTRALLRRWVCAGDLAAPRPRKGNRAEKASFPAPGKTGPRESTRRLRLLVSSYGWGNRPERGGDTPRSVADTRSTLVLR